VRFVTFILFCLSFSFCIAQKADKVSTVHSISNAINSGEPVFFIENKGQWSKEILYRTDLQDHSCQVLENALSFGYVAPPTAEQNLRHEVWERSPPEKKLVTRPSSDNGGFVWNLEFAGANNNVVREQRNFNNGVYHYYRGNDSTKWAIDCRRSSELYYSGVWNNVDLRFYGSNEKHLEYDIILHPGSELSEVRFLITGPVSPRILRDGSMLLSTPLGEIRKSRPVAWQVINGERIPVKVDFRLSGKELYFRTGAYDPDFDLVIDPLIWSTWVSGTKEDSYVFDLVADAAGNTFITGYCNSYTFPTVPGSFNAGYNDGTQDAIVTKVRNDGKGILFTAIFNGKKNDYGYRIFYEYPNVYVTGFTASADFAISPNAYQPVIGQDVRDVFFAKISEDGRKLHTSSFLGGGGYELPYSIFVRNGKLLLGGNTASLNFPISFGGVFNTSLKGGADGFLFCYDTKANAVDFSRLIGGMANEYINGLAMVDGYCYISGTTFSSDFPVTPGSYQTIKNGPQDAFIMKLNSSASSIEYSTFVGGVYADGCNSMVVENGQVYITGTTNSKDFHTSVNAYKRITQGDDAFVFKLSADGKELEYSTLIGTDKNELGIDLIVKNGIVTLAGVTNDGNKFGMTEEIVDKGLFGGQDLFLVMLDAQGSKILYSTVIGGNGNDYLPAIAMNKCNTYVSITSHSPSFPTTPDAFMIRKPNSAEDAMAVFSIELSKFIMPDVNPRKLPPKINICSLMKSTDVSTGILNTYWSTGESDSSITISKPGVYHAYIYISCDSFYHDSTIAYEAEDDFDLGPDVYVCKTPFIHTLSCPLLSCTWSTGEKTSSIQVSKPGLYWVEAVNACAMVRRDSVEILLDLTEIKFRLPADSLFCENGRMTLSTGLEKSKWSDGSTGKQLKVTKPGIYWAEAINKCLDVHRDSFSYGLLGKPRFRLCNDTVICSRNFDVQMSSGFPGTKWSTGKTGSSEKAKKPGLYWAEYTDRCGASFRDSFSLELDTASIVFSLPPDTVYCGNSFLRTLHSGTSRTLWSTGEAGERIVVKNPGIYTAVNSNRCGDTHIESISLYLLEIPDIELSGDTVICGSFRMELDCGSDSAKWSDGSSGRNKTANTFGVYSATYANRCGYSADTMEITHDTLYKELFVPNAFTPDGNFINETFPSPHIPFTDFRISIFTRWGERIYDAETQWDGRVKGEIAAEGVYLWLINYRDCQGRRKFMSGTLTLLR
jgi:gliding motility-associated-like protein